MSQRSTPSNLIRSATSAAGRVVALRSLVLVLVLLITSGGAG